MLFLAKVGTSLGCSPSLLSSSGVFFYSFLKGTNNGWSNGITPKSSLILLVKYSQEKKNQAITKEEIVENSSFSYKCIPHFLVLHFFHGFGVL